MVFGTPAMRQAYLGHSPVSQHPNTPFVERHAGATGQQNGRFALQTLGLSMYDRRIRRRLHLSPYYRLSWAHSGPSVEITRPLRSKGHASPGYGDR